MSSALTTVLNRSPVSDASIAHPSAHCFPRSPVEICLATTVRYSSVKSTTSKQLKRVVKTSAFADKKCGDDAAVVRKSGNYNPSVWGDFFLAYEDMEALPEEEEKELKELRDEIIMILKRTPDKSHLKLELIDIIQRLGVSYQFKDQIETSLSNILTSYLDVSQNDLHTVALRFRLLRQQGYRVSSDVLNKFLKREGGFDETSWANDVRGLLSLYEASHYAIHGENTLDEAFNFTTTTLESMKNKASGFIAKQIDHALTWPIRRTTKRVMARKYISVYQNGEAHNELLLRFAKLDFNRVQRVHQQELCSLTKWWNGIDTTGKYPFARNRLVENYFGTLGMHFEPEFGLSRKYIIMGINLLTTMDDLYDIYGTLDELLLFTDAVERWNIDAVNQLPPYMKPFYEFLLNSYAEMEEDLAERGMKERIEYMKEEMQIFAKLCYKEACWIDADRLPIFEEYMDVAAICIAVNFMITHSYAGMKDVNKTVLDWSMNRPLAIQAAATISRLLDDLYDHKDTGRTSAVQCYMKQYNVSRQEALEEIKKLINYAYKDLNNESLLPTVMPLVVMEIPITIIQALFTNYIYGEAFTHVDSSSTKLIKSIFVDPVI